MEEKIWNLIRELFNIIKEYKEVWDIVISSSFVYGSENPKDIDIFIIFEKEFEINLPYHIIFVRPKYILNNLFVQLFHLAIFSGISVRHSVLYKRIYFFAEKLGFRPWIYIYIKPESESERVQIYRVIRKYRLDKFKDRDYFVLKVPISIWEKVRKDLLKFNIVAEKLVLEGMYWIRGKKGTAEILKD